LQSQYVGWPLLHSWPGQHTWTRFKRREPPETWHTWPSETSYWFVICSFSIWWMLCVLCGVCCVRLHLEAQSASVQVPVRCDWCILLQSSRQIDEDLNVIYFASQIRALTESLDLAFAEVGSQLVWLGRYLCWWRAAWCLWSYPKGSYRLTDASEAAANKAARLTQQLLCNLLCVLLLEFSVSYPNCKWNARA
jgi:hypothetical protein